MGIRASATCVMNFDEAQGWMVGQPNKGLAAMFTMMNTARLAVGVQGLGLTERAYQNALAYARERLQMRALSGAKYPDKPADPLIVHPDIRRMLLTQKAFAESERLLSLYAYQQEDIAKHSTDAAERERAQTLVSFLTPIVKGGGTEMCIDVTSLGIQVHGGMGFIEETGAAQYWRDSRITTIYEGTTGIQANDLLFRKLMRDGGATAKVVFGEVETTAQALAAASRPELQAFAQRLGSALKSWGAATEWLAASAQTGYSAVLAAAVPYLHLAVTVCGGWLMGKAALAAARHLDAGEGDAGFYRRKIVTACFYADQILPQARAWAETVQAGDRALAGAEDPLV
jgi:acyl-CoA dehydrogenase